MSGLIYMLKLECVRCHASVLGPGHLKGEDFFPGAREEFFDDVWEVGWVFFEGVWLCDFDCPGFVIDVNDFSLRKSVMDRYRTKLISPEFFGTVTVDNL